MEGGSWHLEGGGSRSWVDADNSWSSWDVGRLHSWGWDKGGDCSNWGQVEGGSRHLEEGGSQGSVDSGRSRHS